MTARTTHLFVPNLRGLTHDPRFRRWLQPRGYLLPPDRPTSTLGRLAAQVRRNRLRLYVDNGNFATIGALAQRHAAEAAALVGTLRADARECSTSNPASPANPANGIRQQATTLARTVADEAARAPRVALADRLALGPSRLIGAEDPAMALWLALSLEPEYLDLTRADYATRNETVAADAAREQATLPPARRRGYHAVASAVSYDTARDAGAAFARHGLRRLAVGFGAFMADDHYTDHVVIDGRSTRLPTPMPQRYLRTPLVARGLVDGYRETAGEPPAALHCLGLGAPLMIAIAAVAAHGIRDLSFDATSPIKDAVEGTLYLADPYLKVRTRQIALDLCTDPDARWDCPCPFCADFISRHPFDLSAARAAHTASGHPGVSVTALAAGGALSAALPLLCEPRERRLSTEVDFARIGHNHWIIEHLMRRLDAARDRAALVDLVTGLVAAYAASTTPRFGAAMTLALRLAQDPRATCGTPVGG